ncbi:MAG: A24 family peptidase [Chloroflexota bacterium]|nr:A24 family peptidase [Chloroflexota bacterium]
MTIITMAIVGFFFGFVLDYLVARLAREPYVRADAAGVDTPALKSDAARLTLAPFGPPAPAEVPTLLTTHSVLRTIFVVAATAVSFALIGLQYRGSESELAIAAFYASALIICAATDLLSFRVPNSVTYPAIVAAFVIGMVIPGANRLDVVAGGLLFGGLLLVPSILTGGAMGMGDVKLAFFVGFALGLTLVVPAMLVMAISGGLAAAMLIITRLRGQGDPIPYAPFIAAGALIVLLVKGTAFHSI